MVTQPSATSMTESLVVGKPAVPRHCNRPMFPIGDALPTPLARRIVHEQSWLCVVCHVLNRYVA